MDTDDEKDEIRRRLVTELADTHYVLTTTEKQFLLCAERGDVATAQKMIETHEEKSEEFNINCMDPLNRTALIIAIEKENIDLMEILLNAGIQVKDALLHAIDEEYVEGVELLLQWEEEHHVEGQPYSWEVSDSDSSTYTQDVTPIILAAHKNNYEVLKLLMDRGATLPVVHDVRCACDECTVTSQLDSLRHSNSRMNVYKALTSPSLICLSSRDPLLTALELFWELKSLSNMEAEFKSEYTEMRDKVQTFASTLLDHLRTSKELEIILNYSPSGNPWEPGDEPSLERLKLAIKYKLKLFVAHPTVQQHLASIWYKGLPGFKKKNMMQQFIDVSKIGMMFWLYCIIYMINPNSEKGRFMKLPFVKFVCESASYLCFLGLLSMASQRIELYALKFLGMEMEWARLLAQEMIMKERGALPGLIETLIILYVISLIFQETKTLYTDGLMEYMSDLWNVVDFFAFTFYSLWICLKLTGWFVVYRELANGHNPWYPRHKWATFEPNLVSEGAFTAGMIISYLKLVHIFSINSHLGPLQISLGRMIIDIIKFLIIYTLVLFAFGCGLTQLLWYFASQEEMKCYPNDSSIPDFDNQDKACTIWRRFVNLFEASQSLFWAGFGLVDLTAFDLTGIKSFTRFWALLIFGSYSVMNIIVLLNMLIAMMSNSYQIISERADSEWKYARSKLFINYFESGGTLPAPFNLMPTMKNVKKIFGEKESAGSIKRKKAAARDKADLRYEIIMQMLIRRYVTSEQKKMEDFSITEDDIAEVRHDISTMRFEILDIFRKNGYKVGKMPADESVALARKDKIMERRILKDFQIGVVENLVQNAIMSEKEPQNIFGKIAKAIKRGESSKKDWNSIVQKSVKGSNPIGRSSIKTDRLIHRRRSQTLRRYIMEHEVAGAEQIDPEKLAEYNPNLSEMNPATRIAYAKFKMKLLKNEHHHVTADNGDDIVGVESGNDNDESPQSSSAIVKQFSEGKQRQSTVETINEQASSNVGTTSTSIRPRPSSGRSRKRLSSVPGKLPISIAEELLQDEVGVVGGGDESTAIKPESPPSSDNGKMDDRSRAEIKSSSSMDDKSRVEEKRSKPEEKIIAKTKDEQRQRQSKKVKAKESKSQDKDVIISEKPTSSDEGIIKAGDKDVEKSGKHEVIYELKQEPKHPPGKGKSVVSGSVISGWI